jgi:hypothetical protein
VSAMSCRVRAFLRSRSPTVTMHVSVTNLGLHAIVVAHTTAKRANAIRLFEPSGSVRARPDRNRRRGRGVFSGAQLCVD